MKPDPQNPFQPRHAAAEPVVRNDRAIPLEKRQQGRHDGGPEHRHHRRIAHHHEHDNRHQRNKMEPVFFRKRTGAMVFFQRNHLHVELARTISTITKNREVKQHRRDCRHQDHVAEYEIFRNSAIRNAAAPSTGGEMIAPRPPADSRPPAASLPHSISPTADKRLRPASPWSPRLNPRARRAGMNPSRPHGRRSTVCRPLRRTKKSMKNLPAPEYCRNAP